MLGGRCFHLDRLDDGVEDISRALGFKVLFFVKLVGVVALDEIRNRRRERVGIVRLRRLFVFVIVVKVTAKRVRFGTRKGQRPSRRQTSQGKVMIVQISRR